MSSSRSMPPTRSKKKSTNAPKPPSPLRLPPAVGTIDDDSESEYDAEEEVAILRREAEKMTASSESKVTEKADEETKYPDEKCDDDNDEDKGV